jgi:hypothetical protein
MSSSGVSIAVIRLKPKFEYAYRLY